MSQHISSLNLNRLRCGELAPSDEGAVRSHIANCPTCERRLHVQVERRQAFVHQPVPPAILQGARPWWQRLAAWFSPEIHGFSRSILAFAVVPVAAVALLGVGAELGGSTSDPVVAIDGEDGIREKGALPRLEVWIQTESGVRMLAPGEKLPAGAKVQLKFKPGTRRFVTLAGRDGAGAVEVYGTLPASGAELQTAPFALTLDNTAGEQAFYAVLTDARPNADALLESLRNDPSAVANGDVERVSFQKE